MLDSPRQKSVAENKPTAIRLQLSAISRQGSAGWLLAIGSWLKPCRRAPSFFLHQRDWLGKGMGGHFGSPLFGFDHRHFLTISVWPKAKS
jgi:hypothetical protein